MVESNIVPDPSSGMYERLHWPLEVPRRSSEARFTALVQIFAEASGLDRVERALSRLENLVGLFEVTGEFDIVALVSAADNEEFGEVLNRIRRIEGVKATVISVVLKDLRAPILESSF
jgi:DNA-binding Lrp family transcriptional regulator